jgi:hypothetical protein
MCSSIALFALALASPSMATAQHQRGGTRIHDLRLSEPDPAGPPSDVRFELLGGALAPLDVELTGRVVFFDRLLLSLSLGVGAFGDASRGLALALGADVEGAQLAHDLSSGLFALRASVGFRPLEGEGLELAVGYALLTNRIALGATSFTRATGVDADGTFVDTGYTLHAVHAEVGWTFRLLDHLLLRPALGWLHVLDAEVSLDDSSTPYADQALDALAYDAASHAETWGMTPTISFSVGYLF